jgi:peptide/nickel transport system substrate-binding protein
VILSVRWAVSYALNRQQLVDVGWGGAGSITVTPFPAYPKLMEYVDGIKDILDRHQIETQNLERSAQLMEDAGYVKNGEGFWSKTDGTVLDFDLYAAVPLFGDTGPLVAEQLRSGGLQVRTPRSAGCVGGEGRWPRQPLPVWSRRFDH